MYTAVFKATSSDESAINKLWDLESLRITAEKIEVQITIFPNMCEKLAMAWKDLWSGINVVQRLNFVIMFR